MDDCVEIKSTKIINDDYDLVLYCVSGSSMEVRDIEIPATAFEYKNSLIENLAYVRFTQGLTEVSTPCH